MSVAMLERAARELAPFLDEVAFLGGATVVLWITDPAAPEPRPTKDVDVVVEIASRLAWHDFGERLRGQGLRNDASSRVICRWVAHGFRPSISICCSKGDGDGIVVRVICSLRRALEALGKAVDLRPWQAEANGLLRSSALGTTPMGRT